MTPPDSRPSVSADLEPKPKVLVDFYGYAHYSLNLQPVEQMLEAFSQHLQYGSGVRRLFIETGDATLDDSRYLSSLIDRYGGLKGMLVASNYIRVRQVDPTVREVEEIIQVNEETIQNGKLDQLYAVDHPQDYMLYRGFDELRNRYPFSIDFETHSLPIKARVNQTRKSMKDVNDKTLSAWNNGNYEEFLVRSQNYHKLMLALQTSRDPEILEFFRRRVRGMLQDQEGGSMFILMGGFHSSLADSLSGKFKKGQITVRKLAGENQDFIDLDPETNILMGLAMNNLVTEAIKNGTLPALMTDFQTVESEVRKIIEQLSIDEKRQVCENHIDLLQALRDKGLNF